MEKTGVKTAAASAGREITRRVGMVTVATRECSVFAFGEAGVCYEAYPRSGGELGWSSVFERGGFDGFSAEDVALCMRLTGEVVPELAGYVFEGVGRLWEDGRTIYLPPSPTPGDGTFVFGRSA